MADLKPILTCETCRFSTHIFSDTGKKLCGTPVVFNYYICHKTPHLLQRSYNEWCAEGLWDYEGRWVNFEWKKMLEE